MRHLLFLLGFALIATHELDAVMQAEWRLLYILRALPEPLAAQIFIAVHVPLFVGLLWLHFHPRTGVREWSRFVLAVFLVVHAGLHARLSGHPLYSFDSPVSLVLIFGAGLVGLLYCLVTVQHWRRQTH